MTSTYLTRAPRSEEQAFNSLGEERQLELIRDDLDRLEWRFRALLLKAEHPEIIEAAQEASSYAGDALSVVGNMVKECGLRDIAGEVAKAQYEASRESAMELKRG